MSLYKRKDTWWLYITHQGKRIRRTAGTADKQEAQRIHDEIKAELWREKRPDHKLFDDAVKIWLASGDKGAPDRYRLRAFNLAGTPLAEIDEARLNTILSSHKGSSRNRCINLLHAILAIAQQHGWIEKIPHMQRVKVKDARIRWLTSKEWTSLQAELPCHLRNMARFAIATGLRENNVIGLEWSQVDVARRVAWIHPDQSKTGKPIGLPLNDEAMRVLQAQDGQHEKYVFVYNGHAVTKTSTKAWWAALDRAGIDNFRWHDLRHTWASWHVMNGTPLEVLQKLGGWKTLQMVTRYAHLAPEHLARYAGNAAPLETPQIARNVA